MAKTLFKFFFIHYLISIIWLLLFKGLIVLCFLPLGVALTIFGYLISFIAMIALSASCGMMMAITQKQTKMSSSRVLLGLWPLFALPVILSLKYFFSNEWDYVLVVSLPAFLMSGAFWIIGKKSLDKKSK